MSRAPSPTRLTHTLWTSGRFPLPRPAFLEFGENHFQSTKGKGLSIITEKIEPSPRNPGELPSRTKVEGRVYVRLGRLYLSNGRASSENEIERGGQCQDILF